MLRKLLVFCAALGLAFSVLADPGTTPATDVAATAVTAKADVVKTDKAVPAKVKKAKKAKKAEKAAEVKAEEAVK